jgi:hypothetical protein
MTLNILNHFYTTIINSLKHNGANTITNDKSMNILNYVECAIVLAIVLNLHTPLTLYPRRGSRGISDIPPRHPRFTN